MAANKKQYVMGLISGVALMVIVIIAFPRVFSAQQGLVAEPEQSAPYAQSGGLDLVFIGQKLTDIYDIINRHYIGEFDVEHAIETMFQGFVYGVGDPYTAYLTAEAFMSFTEDTEGEFFGIGVSVVSDPSDNRIMIIAPIEGSPAFHAGLLPGDKIIRVDGVEVFGDNLNAAVRMMRGEQFTPVDVTILRETDGSVFEVTIIRELIQTQTVRHEILPNNIGYLRISSFDRVTFDQFVVAYEELLAAGIDGLILDVRNNPGGLLSIVNQIANLIVPEGIITFTEDVRGNRSYARSDARQIEIPLVVLVNGNSASASEVLAGAVRDTGVGELVGTTTFGKGLVQSLFVLPDSSAVKVTIAHYFTPAGISIHGDGIMPNHYIEMSQELTNNLSRISQEEDIQLQYAIELMQGMIE